MRPLRPLFNRHSPDDALEREAERLKNRDWVEFLRVVHPAQAESAEREYIIARLSHDWAELTSPLLATHSLPSGLLGKTLTVACDHNTFANELSLVAPAVEKKIAARYGITVKIRARATRRMVWGMTSEAPPRATKAEPLPASENTQVIDELIKRLTQ